VERRGRGTGPQPSPATRAASPRSGRDFYAEVARHPEAHKVFTGGQAQVDRLKGALLAWLRDLLTGPYDRDYIVRRWRVGARHVEIGLDQVYTNAALSRIRDGLMRQLGESWPGDRDGLVAAIRSLNKLLDLDLAKIDDAYQSSGSILGCSRSFTPCPRTPRCRSTSVSKWMFISRWPSRPRELSWMSIR
jgi:truncated hemoglobin YjbI